MKTTHFKPYVADQNKIYSIHSKFEKKLGQSVTNCLESSQRHRQSTSRRTNTTKLGLHVASGTFRNVIIGIISVCTFYTINTVGSGAFLHLAASDVIL